MRKLSMIQDMRGKFTKRGNALSLVPNISPAELEELHFIRILDSGHIDSMWDAIREFVACTNLQIFINEART